MKIGLIVQRFPGGGAENYVEEIAKRLVRDKIDVTVVTSDNKYFDDSKFDFKIIRLPTSIRIGEYSFWRGLEKILREEKFDIIHSNTYGYYHTDKVAQLKKKFGYKLVITSHGFHGTDIHELKRNKIIEHSSKFDFIREFYDEKIGKKTILKADHLIALSEKEKILYRNLGVLPSKITIIPPGIKNSFFDPKFKKNNTQKFFENDFILLTIGELSWIKSKSLCIEAMPKILKSKPRTRLLIIGKNKDQLPILKDLVANYGIDKKVHFLGFKPEEEVISYLHSADLLIHPSLAEGLSTILLESMACGLPFITTPAGGNGLLAHESKAGIEIPFGDSEFLSNLIIELIDDPDRLSEMSENGKIFSSNLGWDKIYQKILEVYNTLFE